MAIPDKDLKEIASRIEKAGRPLVFYDNDADGLTSYFLLRRFNSNCIGVRAAKGPELTVDYSRKVDENMPDLIIIVDKPRVTKEFFEKVRTPTIWIDHHGLDQEAHKWKFKHLKYYNPKIKDEKDSKPVAYWCWKITNGPVWLGAVGTLADWHEDLLAEFAKEHPKLAPKKLTVKEGLYNSKLGEIVRIFNFSLKGQTAQISKNINALMKIESPEELINEESSRAHYVMKHYKPILEEYERQRLEADKTKVKGGLFVHVYEHLNVSLISEVANYMLVKKKGKVFILGRKDGSRIKFSMRSHKVDLVPVIAKALVGVEGYGGGHKEACGGSVEIDHWDHFIDNIRELI